MTAHDDKSNEGQSLAAEIEEALWALHSYESNRDDAGRVYSELDITNMVTALRAFVPSSKGQFPACPKCGERDVQAAGPDWADTGITSEMTCPRCEHTWTATFSVVSFPSAIESSPMTEQELTLLIDYHDNQDAMAEAMGVDECSLYHAKRSAEWSAMRDVIRKREADTLAKMVRPASHDIGRSRGN